MAASVVDLVRPAQKSIAAAAVPAPKPTRRFDDVLASRREQAKPQPKADTTARHGKTESAKTDKSKAAKPKADAAQADESTKSDDAPDETEAAHEETTTDSTQAAKPVKKAGLPKKTAEHDDEAQDADAEGATDATVAAKPADATAATPVETDVAVEPKQEKAEKPSDDQQPAAESQAIPNPAALAAQINAAPVPTADTSGEAKPTSDTATAAANTATASVAATAKTAATPQATGPALGDSPAPLEGEHRPTLKAVAEQAAVDPDEAAAAAFQLPPDFEKATAKPADSETADPLAALQAAMPHDKAAAHAALPAVQQATSDVAPKTVAENNVDHIVTSVRGELLTKGGTMQIRLDPPSLGAINVQISFDDGVMSASFQTNNDDATRLLSHNLSQLKTQLESTGVSVDHIQVKQAAPSEQSSGSNQQGESGERHSSRETGQEQSARQEQQRREMLARMWAKLSGNGDPLDLVA
ncbi:MAG: hypothetical protein JWM57_1268 [Phycisphaerales bacterium]|nr:hypothetical protein [Phycisphaerales bacterium]